MKKCLMLSLAAILALAVGACGGGNGTECGAGTVEQDGTCVPTCDDGEYWDGTECAAVPACAEGTTFNATTGECVPDIDDCAPGTTLVNGQCVPECGNEEYWDGTVCVAIPDCGQGTTFNEATGQCEPDITDCAPGTHLENGECVPDVVCGADTHPCNPDVDENCEEGECVPNHLPDPDVTEDDVVFSVGAEGEIVSLGGTIDTPVDENDDGVADANWDQFQFQATAGTYLHIWATSEGATLPAFAVMGFDENDEVNYQRIALNPNGLNSMREVYLPRDGVYVILVTDYNNLVNALFDNDGLPVGGPDFTYYVEVETLPPPTPIDVDATDLETTPIVETGDFDDNQITFYSVTNLPIDAVVNMASMGLAPEGGSSDAFPTVLLFAPDGSLQSEGMQAVFFGAAGEYLLVQDFELAIGPNRDFQLSITSPAVEDCAEGCEEMTLDAEGQHVYVFDLLANELFWQYALPTEPFVYLQVTIFDGLGHILFDKLAVDMDFFGVDPANFLQHMAMDTRLIVSIQPDPQDPMAVTYSNYQWIIPESLLAEGENTELPVNDFPAGYWPAAIDQFEATAGQLALFTGYDYTESVAQMIKFVMLPDQTILGGLDMEGDPMDMPIARVPADGRFLHWIFDYDPNGTGNFGAATYDVTLGLLDIGASLGTPEDGTPIQVTTAGLDPNGMAVAHYFTGVLDAGFKVEAAPTAGGDLTAEIYVLTFASEQLDENGEPVMVFDPDGAATYPLASGTGETAYFNAPYDGDLAILVMDGSGEAVGGETYELTLTRAICQVGALRCANDGTNDVVEVCVGDGWEVQETCDEGVACVEDGGAHCYLEGDNCADAFAVVLEEGSFSQQMDSSNFSNALDMGDGEGESCTGYSTSGQDVFWAVELAEGDTIYAAMDAAAGGFDASIYMLNDCANPYDSCVIGADDTFSGGVEEFEYTVPAGEGGLYIIGTDAYSGGGSFDFTVEVTPAY